MRTKYARKAPKLGHIYDEAVCIICGKKFVIRSMQTAKKTCSGPCNKKHAQNRRQKLYAQEPSADNLSGWQLRVWQNLQDHEIPADETYLTQGAAVAASGISQTQLYHLTHQRIIKRVADPVRKHQGKPLMTYPKSVMELIRRTKFGDRN